MGYEVAVKKAWADFESLKPARLTSVRFLDDEYSINLEAKKVLSLSCNVEAKDYTVILILHYLIKKISGLPIQSGEWLDFKELSGVEGYQLAFRQRVIERVIKKYGSNPEGLLSVLERLPGKKSEGADVSIVLNVFENVPVLLQLWKGDQEFSPEANVLFNKSITQIFCTEDIVVLAEFVVHQI